MWLAVAPKRAPDMAGPAPAVSQARGSVLPFFALACALSWTYWAVAAAWSPDLSYYPGLFGPAVAALVVAAGSGADAVRDLLRRCLVWRGGGVLPVVAVATPLVLVAAAWALGETARFAKPGVPGQGVVGFALAMLAASVGEELGWRGLALPRLQVRMDALSASIRLALVWALWHWPLFVLFDNYGDLGLAGVVPWIASLLCASVVFTWLANATGGGLVGAAGGGVLAAILFHAAVDFATAADAAPLLVAVVLNAGVIVAALALPRVYGRRRLAP
jgi:membrane protease YdiL (CAAX protease family)